MSKFGMLKVLFAELLLIEEDIDNNDCNPDNDVRPNCSCGCGGNRTNWDYENKEWEELHIRKIEVENKIKTLLGEKIDG